MSLFVSKIVLASVIFIVGVTGSILMHKPTIATIIVGLTVAIATVTATMIICYIRNKRK